MGCTGSSKRETRRNVGKPYTEQRETENEREGAAAAAIEAYLVADHLSVQSS